MKIPDFYLMRMPDLRSKQVQMLVSMATQASRLTRASRLTQASRLKSVGSRVGEVRRSLVKATKTGATPEET